MQSSYNTSKTKRITQIQDHSFGNGLVQCTKTMNPLKYYHVYKKGTNPVKPNESLKSQTQAFPHSFQSLVLRAWHAKFGVRSQSLVLRLLLCACAALHYFRWATLFKTFFVSHKSSHPTEISKTNCPIFFPVGHTLFFYSSVTIRLGNVQRVVKDIIALLDPFLLKTVQVSKVLTLKSFCFFWLKEVLVVLLFLAKGTKLTQFARS